MIRQLKVSLLCDFFLKFLNDWVVEFFDSSALNANQMVVMVAAVELENRIGPFEVMTNDQSCGFELGQDAINRGQSDFLALADQGFENLFGTQVLGGRRTLQDLKYLEAGQRDLEAGIPDIFAFQMSLPTHCHSGADRL